MPNLHWFCELCNNSACKLLSNLAELNNRTENMEKRSDDLQGKVREMERKTGDLKKEVSNVNDRIDNFEKIQSFEVSETNDLKPAMKKLNDRVEHNPVNFSEIVKQQVTESVEAISDDLHDVKNSIEQTKEQAAEQRDIENRGNNIILYRVPESDEMRAEERNKADVAFCLQLFNNCYTQALQRMI